MQFLSYKLLGFAEEESKSLQSVYYNRAGMSLFKTVTELKTASNV